MKILKHLKRLKKDNGAAVTILGVACIAVILLVAVFIVDFTKARYVSNLYKGYAQTATQTAIREQDGIGGLKPSSVQVLIDEYMLQRKGADKYNTLEDNSSFTKICMNKYDGGGFPRIKITFDTDRGKGAKGSLSVSSRGGVVPSVPSAVTFYKNKYKTIQVDIEDVTYMPFNDIFGEPCQIIQITKSAITSGHFDAEN